MAITVEDGTGIVGAESYSTIAAIKAYWLARGHSSFATTVGAATDTNLEGAAREATAYLDAKYGAHYRGVRGGYLQGLLWPRTGALDEAGFPLPSLPQPLTNVVCELVARALSAALVEDADRGGAIKREKFDKIEFEYFEGASTETSYGVIAGMLAPILNQDSKWLWT